MPPRPSSSSTTQRCSADLAPPADRARAPAARQLGGAMRWRLGCPSSGCCCLTRPLHHLLLGGVGRPLVMTSGNLSDEPIAHDDGDAATRLGALVDGLLTHDRPIHIRCDDSVARAARGALQVLRRSRGYAPEPLALPFAARASILAVGAELKIDVAVTKGPSVVAEPPPRRPRAPRDLPVVPPGGRPSAGAVRRAARGRRARPPSRVPLDQVRRSTSTSPRSRCSTTTPTSPRAWSSTAAPSP